MDIFSKWRNFAQSGHTVGKHCFENAVGMAASLYPTTSKMISVTGFS
jgi:hypothetical protein